MELEDSPCALLQPAGHDDPLVPTDAALMEMAALVELSTDPLAWADALAAAIGPDVTAGERRERLAAVQMHAAIGSPTGARLLAALWVHPAPDTLAEVTAADPGLAALAQLLAARRHHALDLPPLAVATHRMLSILDQMFGVGLCAERADLLQAATIVQSHHDGHRIAVPVEPSLAAVLRRLLAAPRPFTEGFAGSLAGVTMEEGRLVINPAEGGAAFPHGFPVLMEVDGGAAPAADAAPDELDRSAIRKLVLDNIMTTSVLLEFLRDPKISSIPGLVAEVVNRTRNPQVLEVIIANRALHTGFANKAVPLACLRSPVNVPLKSLRKFIHVKYVSRVDLKRLSNDRTGIRREVGQEIARYLESLT